MPQLTIVSKKTVASRFKKVALVAFLIGAGIVGYPFAKIGIHEADNYLAYNSANTSLVQGYSQSRKVLDSVKQRLEPEQIAELEARLAEIHPDKIVLEAKNSEPGRKVELLGKACMEYKSIIQEKPEVVKDYAEASISYIENQFNLRDSSKEMRNILDKLFRDPFIFHTDQDRVSSKVKVDSVLIDKIISSEAGYITYFLKSYADDTQEEMNKNQQSRDVKGVRARVNNIDSIILNSLRLVEIFNPEKKAEYVKILGDAYSEGARKIADSKIDEENKLKVFVFLKRFEKLFSYSSGFDSDPFILNYVNQKIDG